MTVDELIANFDGDLEQSEKDVLLARVTLDVDLDDGDPNKWIELGELAGELIRRSLLQAYVSRWGLSLTSSDIDDIDAQDCHTSLTSMAVESCDRSSNKARGEFSISWCFG